MKNPNRQKPKVNLSVNFVAAAARLDGRFGFPSRGSCPFRQLKFSATRGRNLSAITMRRLVTCLLVFGSLTACGSPEATRTRGGGPGADTGNRTRDVRMHEGSLPYWDTPRLIEAEHPPLDAANHAAEFSRR
jgi:hypothetical protein